MKRAELEEMKKAIIKGKILEDVEVDNKPLNRLGYKWIPLYNVESNTIGWEEVVDEDYIPEHTGDYIDPIRYIEGMNVVAGKFYIGDDENIWEAIKDGYPVDFNDTEYFDIIVI